MKISINPLLVEDRKMVEELNDQIKQAAAKYNKPGDKVEIHSNDHVFTVEDSSEMHKEYIERIFKKLDEMNTPIQDVKITKKRYEDPDGGEWVSEVEYREPWLMSNEELHAKFLDDLSNTYSSKNKDYGNSFEHSLHKHGLMAGVVRMEDKLNRLIALQDKFQLEGEVDEKLEDTMLDLANYAIMTAMFIVKNGRKSGE